MNPRQPSPEPASCEVIVALDVPGREQAAHLLDELGDRPFKAKIGLQLFTRYGPPLVENIAYRGCGVFLDLKLHDIPNTVAHAIESLSHWPVDMLTIHGLGGPGMIRAARKARDRANPGMKIIAVTILTSMDEEQMDAAGIAGSPAEAARRLAAMSLGEGADGLVCSAWEAADLRSRFGSEPILVVPGIRPSGTERGDQKRIMTPGEAALAGASHLVVGRPILEASSPGAMLDQITSDIRNTTRP